MLTVYCHPRCSTCKSALKYLDEQGVKYDLIDITKTSVSKDLLSKLQSSLNLDIKKFYNTSGMQYKELGLKDKIPTMTLDENLDLLSSNGMLVKRPFVTDGTKLTLGYKISDFQIWVK